jgi:hypothetical protein
MSMIYLKQPLEKIIYKKELCCEDPDQRRFALYYGDIVIRVPKSNIAYEEEALPCLKN